MLISVCLSDFLRHQKLRGLSQSHLFEPKPKPKLRGFLSAPRGYLMVSEWVRRPS